VSDVTIGVDVGGTTVAAGLVSADGRVLEHVQAPTHERGAGTALETIGDLLDRLRDGARARGVTVTGVGLGIPGTVDVERGVVGVDVHYAPELIGLPLAARLGPRVGVPVFVDNDVNALALAEWTWGAARGACSLLMLALGTGVGGGIVLDGRPCICGGRGCLKTYVSGTDIARRGEERLGRPIGADEVFRLAAAGRAEAEEIVDEVCRAVGAGLAIIVNGLNPERVLLAGSVAKSLRPLEARLRASLAGYAFRAAVAATHLEILSLDKDATVRGGAALVRYETERRRTTA
jgi:glucokinase